MQPTSDVLLRLIDEAREASRPPPSPQQLYPALVEALREERSGVAALAQRKILYVKNCFVSPNETLVAQRPPRCLEIALPVIRPGNTIADAYTTLGADALPRTHHWTAFFGWIDARLRATQTKVPRLERALLREAYRVRGSFGLPLHVPSNSLCLLSSENTTHSLDDVQAGRFLEDDFPELAQALLATKADIAFADAEESSRIFFRAIGVRPLSDRCGEGRIEVGATAPTPNWFQSKTAIRALQQFHRPDFAAGVAELAYARQAQNPDFHPARTSVVRRRLNAIQAIAFSADLQRYYQVGKRVSVPADAVVSGDTLFLRPPKYRSEYDHIVALELARLEAVMDLSGR